MGMTRMMFKNITADYRKESAIRRWYYERFRPVSLSEKHADTESDVALIVDVNGEHLRLVGGKIVETCDMESEMSLFCRINPDAYFRRHVVAPAFVLGIINIVVRGVAREHCSRLDSEIRDKTSVVYEVYGA